MNETLILCGECGGKYSRIGHDDAVCVSCGHTVSVHADIAPNLEPGESIAVGPWLAYVAAVAS